MKIIKIIFFMICSVINLHAENNLPSLINELYSKSEDVRFNAIKKIEKISLTLNEQLLLLDKAKDSFPETGNHSKNIPEQLVEIATAKNDIKIVEYIKLNFKYYSSSAKIASLRFLSNFDNAFSIQTYKELLLKYPSEISTFSTGILKKNYAYKNIIFPELLNIIDNESIDSEILLLFLNYLENNQLQAKDFNSYVDKILGLSAKYRNIIKTEDPTNINIDENTESKDALIKLGIIADLLGYFEGDKVVSELSTYLTIQNAQLKMFTVNSLIKLGRNVDSRYYDEIAADSETRILFYQMLETLNKEHLFPSKYKTQELLAESDLVNWLVFPTELGVKPDSVELMKVVQVDTKSTDGIVEFYLFRFKSSNKEWIENGWMTGVSGYYTVKNKPSANAIGYTFSSFEKWDDKTLDEHVKDVLELIKER